MPLIGQILKNFPPWALLWIKGGKFISRLTQNEIEETWCSLNGLKDEVILEVKANTTLSGFFFDTYKEDNEGQVTLEINSLTKAELKEKYQEQENQVLVTGDSYVSVVSSTSGSRTKETAYAMSGGGFNGGNATDFSFNFDEAQMEKMWQEMAAKIETSVTVTDEKDEKKEAAYWDNLEKWLLKGYQSQAKKLAMQVARVEFMIKTLTQQMEVNFSQNFQAWTNHFNNHLNNLFTTRIPRIVNEQVNLRITDQTQDVKNLVIGQIQTELNERVESVVNLKIANQTQEIKNLVIEQMQSELEQRISNVVNVQITDHSQEINAQITKQISNDIDQRIDNALNVKIANQAQEISNHVIQQIYNDVEQRINSIVSLKISDQAQNIKNLVIQQIQSYIDQRIKSIVDQSTDKNVQVVVNNVVKDIDNRINVNLDNKILNFRNDVSTLVKNEINQNFTDNIKATILSDLKNQQFYVDMQSIKAEVENFYSRLAQFETQLYFRVEQGDTQLYNWTLEQLVALQGCLTDRQALVEMFESFASKLKQELDNAECVYPSRFTPWVRTDWQAQLESSPSRGLPQA